MLIDVRSKHVDDCPRLVQNPQSLSEQQCSAQVDTSRPAPARHWAASLAAQLTRPCSTQPVRCGLLWLRSRFRGEVRWCRNGVQGLPSTCVSDGIHIELPVPHPSRSKLLMKGGLKAAVYLNNGPRVCSRSTTADSAHSQDEAPTGTLWCSAKPCGKKVIERPQLLMRQADVLLCQSCVD